LYIFFGVIPLYFRQLSFYSIVGTTNFLTLDSHFTSEVPSKNAHGTLYKTNVVKVFYYLDISGGKYL